MMQSLLLDELSAAQVEEVREILGERLQKSSYPDTYWLALPDNLLDNAQAEHRNACGPYRLAAVVEERQKLCKLELLVRAENNLHCECITMITDKQRQWLLSVWDEICREIAAKQEAVRQAKASTPTTGHG